MSKIMIKFACFSPHPPILLPGVGEEKDKELVRQTIIALKKLNKQLNREKVDQIIGSLAGSLDNALERWRRLYLAMQKQIADDLNIFPGFDLMAAGRTV
jgi:hypothetical protein